MIYFFYSLLLGFAMLLTSPYWLYRALRHGKYHIGFWERLGRVPPRLKCVQNAQHVIWVHAVSVGEVLAVSGLVQAMRREFPGYRVVVTTTTDTGQAIARKRFGEENVFYFPMDLGFAIRPVLRALRPELIVLAETELWPNFLRLAHANGAKIAVANARISDRSWPNYRRFRFALKRILAQVDLFLAQTAQDAGRLGEIGAPLERVRVTGNLKFDVAVPSPPSILEKLKQSFANGNAGPVLVCGSTVEGEEPLLLTAFRTVLEKYPHAVMILAPRHPERFAEVANLIATTGLTSSRRSQWSGEPLVGNVLLLDSVGELAALYMLADVAFVGGSLVPRGGHNLIEPAQYGVAMIVGPHTENFRDVVGQFQRQSAVRVVAATELGSALLQLLKDDAERRALGERARETARSQMGATGRTIDAFRILLAINGSESSAQAANHH